ncbi:MAG: hypothetical protein P4L45_16435 [Ignavibacteriaceae bacterium]|nr:hypothetical protein [Ignavibacteriaceae bacterium]
MARTNNLPISTFKDLGDCIDGLALTSSLLSSLSRSDINKSELSGITSDATLILIIWNKIEEIRRELENIQLQTINNHTPNEDKEAA